MRARRGAGKNLQKSDKSPGADCAFHGRERFSQPHQRETRFLRGFYSGLAVQLDFSRMDFPFRPGRTCTRRKGFL